MAGNRLPPNQKPPGGGCFFEGSLFRIRWSECVRRTGSARESGNENPSSLDLAFWEGWESIPGVNPSGIALYSRVLDFLVKPPTQAIGTRRQFSCRRADAFGDFGELKEERIRQFGLLAAQAVKSLRCDPQ